jgi:hypothetical protein
MGVRSALLELTALIDEDRRLTVDKGQLLSCADHLVDSVGTLWRNVQEGKVKVESVALLRAVNEVSCQDLSGELNEPSLQHDRILRDLRLLTNLMDHVIIPQSNRGSKHLS